MLTQPVGFSIIQIHFNVDNLQELEGMYYSTLLNNSLLLGHVDQLSFHSLITTGNDHSPHF